MSEHSLQYFEDNYLYRAFPLSSKYTLRQKLGEGTDGCVYSGKVKDKHSIKATPEDCARFRGTLLERRTKTFGERNLRAISLGQVAIKKLETHHSINDLPGTAQWLYMSEITFVQEVRPHPNLIQFYDAFMDTSDNKATLVMERMESDLKTVLRNKAVAGFPLSGYKYDVVKAASRQIINGLTHIHKHGYVHRDIKPGNILVAHDPKYYAPKIKGTKPRGIVFKIADYGMAVEQGSSHCGGGTLHYVAPEIGVNWDDLNVEYYYTDSAVDMWSLGAVIFEIATGLSLYQSSQRCGEELDDEDDAIIPFIRNLGMPLENSPYGTSKTVLNYLAERSMTIPSEDLGVDAIEANITDKHLRDVLRACLQWDPRRRKSAKELLELPYFARYW